MGRVQARDSGVRRLAVAATAAGSLLVATLAFAAVGGVSPAARHVPTIVTDRPVRATALGARMALPSATLSELPAATVAATVGGSATTATKSTAKTAPAAVASAPHATSRETVTSASSARTEAHHPDDTHEVVGPAIRDEESAEHEDPTSPTGSDSEPRH